MTGPLRPAAIGFALVLAVAVPAAADHVEVVDAFITAEADGRYQLDVTVAHADTGWEHFADLWQVTAPDGTVLAERALAHPHETEQPFTRSLSGVAIPPDVGEVTIRARCSVFGFGGPQLTIEVPRPFIPDGRRGLPPGPQSRRAPRPTRSRPPRGSDGSPKRSSPAPAQAC
jgi:hypothetical protein